MNTSDHQLDSSTPAGAVVGPAARRAEPIPGYVIKERVGTGGYGEVWKAEAPGGLMKAVKFVYGALDDVRASRELKSLNRIKEVHHPFLLSLERIEVVDGQLVIVTELADSCLKDRFVECRGQGLPGIPRDELLGYLRDAADALDFLYEKHMLQHLDVKPENLLLLSGRIKVADFGLLKDLRDTCASQMGGLTPSYSPPEVFDGRPSRHSDQYSLAIVYQEMLTGEPPFGGRTTAQLAAQHLHSPPMLGALPPSDQPIIARALAKDSKRRFSSCRELIEELLQPRAPSRPRAFIRTAAPASDRADKTQISADPRLGAALVAATQPMCARKAQIRSLPPLALDEAVYRPVVFIGLGGTGARVLCRIRRRLSDGLHDLDQVPAIQMLLLDTDVKALAAATYGEPGASLRERDTVALRLRTTKEYQAESKRLLEWMSRRWLYNIPRSLQTEGIRPLGRLAFVDHSKLVLQRIRKAISTAISRESLQQASQATGIDFQALPPRVFVIASTSGGTGSGAVCDLGYAVRAVLAELGQSDEEVSGVLAHSTNRKASARDLSIANTCACLHEIRHFSRPESHYPGDAAAELPAFVDDSVTFRHAYLVHLGDELDDAQFEAAVDDLAEYIFRSSLTSASAFFDQARRGDDDAPRVDLESETIRSFGLSAISGRNDVLAIAETESLCRTLIELWRGTDGPQEALPGGQHAAAPLQEAEIHGLSAECAEVLGLDLDQLSEKSQALVERQVGDPRRYAAELVATLSAGAGAEERIGRVLKGIDTLLTARGSTATESLREFLSENREQRIARKASTICKWVFELVNTSRARIRGAQHAAAWFERHLAALQAAATDLVEQANADANRIRKALWNDESHQRPPSAIETADRQLVQYAYSRIVQAVHQETLDQLRSFAQHVRNCASEIRRLETELIALGTSFARSEGNPKNTDPIAQQIHRRRHELAVLVDQGLAASLFSSDRSLCHILGGSVSERQELVAVLRTTAREVILRTRNELNLARLTASLHSGQGTNDASVREHLRHATPKLLACGGAKRLLLIAPEETLAERIQAQIWQETTDKPTLIIDPQVGVLACYEAEDLSIDEVLRTVVGNRVDFFELAARLHTRSDVEWSPFPSLF